MTTSAPKFKPGDAVEWVSLPRGKRVEHTGTVLVAVAPMHHPQREVQRAYGTSRGLPPVHGGLREDWSYVVEDGAKLYWPPAAALRAAQ
jgi:hypothetical protein